MTPLDKIKKICDDFGVHTVDIWDGTDRNPEEIALDLLSAMATRIQNLEVLTARNCPSKAKAKTKRKTAKA